MCARLPTIIKNNMDFASLTSFSGWVGVAVLVILYILFPGRRKVLDESTNQLVKTLQDTVIAMRDELKHYKDRTETLEDQQKQSTERIKSLEDEKELLHKFIAGRDGITIETNALVKEMVKGLTENNAMTKKFVDILDQHLLNVERVAIKP